MIGEHISRWRFYSDLEEHGIDRKVAEEILRKAPQLIDETATAEDLLALQAAVVLDFIDADRIPRARGLLLKQLRDYLVRVEKSERRNDRRVEVVDRATETLNRYETESGQEPPEGE